jgi:hypothetical protein
MLRLEAMEAKADSGIIGGVYVYPDQAAPGRIYSPLRWRMAIPAAACCLQLQADHEKAIHFWF